jgi:WD repeat-containing protein 23
MASPGLPSEETRDPAEDLPVWHPAQEWPDEADTTTESDYHPNQSRSEDDELMTNEDDDMTPGRSRGHSNDTEEGAAPEGNEQLNIRGIHIELDETGGYIEYVSGDDPDVDVDDMLVIGETDDPRSKPIKIVSCSSFCKILCQSPSDHSYTVERSEIFQLLATTGLREMLYSNGWPHGTERDEFGEVEDYDEDVLSHLIGRRAGRRRRPEFVWPKIPSDAGTKLMASGHFGTNPYYVDRIKKRKEVFATNLMRRELGVDSHGVRKRADQSIFQVRTDSRIANPKVPPFCILIWHILSCRA